MRVVAVFPLVMLLLQALVVQGGDLYLWGQASWTLTSDHLGTMEWREQDSTQRESGVVDVVGPPSSVVVGVAQNLSFAVTLNTTSFGDCVSSTSLVGIATCSAEVGVCSPVSNPGNQTSVQVTQFEVSATDPSILFAEFYVPITLNKVGDTYSVVAYITVGSCQINDQPVVLSLPSHFVVVTPAPNMLLIGDEVFVAVKAIQAMAACILLALLVTLFRVRKHQIIREAQLSVYVVMIGSCSVTVWGVTYLQNSTDFECNARRWFVDVAVAFVFCVMIGRIWRIDRQCSAAKHCGQVTIASHRVILVSLALISPLVLVYSVRMVHAPLYARLRKLENGLDYEYFCWGENLALYNGLYWCYGVFIFPICVFAAVRGSKSVDRFNEGKTAAFALHNGGVLAFVTFPPTVLAKGQPGTMFFLSTICVLVVPVVMIASLLVPKFRLINKKKETSLADGKSENQIVIVPQTVAEVAQLLGNTLPDFGDPTQRAPKTELERVSRLAARLEILATNLLLRYAPPPPPPPPPNPTSASAPRRTTSKTFLRKFSKNAARRASTAADTCSESEHNLNKNPSRQTELTNSLTNSGSLHNHNRRASTPLLSGLEEDSHANRFLAPRLEVAVNLSASTPNLDDTLWSLKPQSP